MTNAECWEQKKMPKCLREREENRDTSIVETESQAGCVLGIMSNSLGIISDRNVTLINCRSTIEVDTPRVSMLQTICDNIAVG